LVSPTVFRWRQYRFYFFSREETRPHVHVSCSDGEAKFWLDPVPDLARNHGLSSQQLVEVKRVLEARSGDILEAWREHFLG
jgi:hypothetical protein